MTRSLRFAARAAAVLVAILLTFPGTPARAADKPAGKPIKALLVCGGCCHDYKNQQEIITKGISARANVEWTIAYMPGEEKDKLNPLYEKDNWADGFDIIVHDECTSGITDLKIVERILKPHKEGLPAVFLHCAMHSFRSDGWETKPTPWMELLGVHSIKHGPKEPIEIAFTGDSPITAGLANWTTVGEELYNNIGGKPLATATTLATGKQKVKDGVEQSTVVWTNTYAGKTKVFGTTLGHFNETVADARYLNLITRGMLWTLGRLDDFKSSDQGFDLKQLPGSEAPAPKKKKKADAGKAPGTELVKEIKCCGDE